VLVPMPSFAWIDDVGVDASFVDYWREHDLTTMMTRMKKYIVDQQGVVVVLSLRMMKEFLNSIFQRQTLSTMTTTAAVTSNMMILL
jgi:hypothetical protein